MMQNLRAVFREAVAEGVLEANPCDHPKFKLVTHIVPPKKLKAVLLTDDGYDQLLNGIKETNREHTYEAVRFLSLCRARIDCARRMLKTDVNLDEDSFTFRREIIKGGMKPTGKDIVFPLYPELRDCVNKLLTFDHRDEYLFPVYDVRKQMKVACKKLGLKHQSPHLLRHVFGTRLVSAENQQYLSIADAAELMCHRAGGKLMLTRYVHVSQSLRTSIQKIRIMRPLQGNLPHQLGKQTMMSLESCGIFEPSKYRRNFRMFAKIARPSDTASTIVAKLSSVRTTSAASLETSCRYPHGDADVSRF